MDLLGLKQQCAVNRDVRRDLINMGETSNYLRLEEVVIIFKQMMMMIEIQSRFF